MGIRNRMTVEALERMEVDEPEWFEALIAEYIEGDKSIRRLGGPIDDKAFTYAGLLEWIAKDAERQKKWDEAKQKRREFRAERVDEIAYEIATTVVVLSESSVMKAIDMLRNPKGGITVQGDGKITIIHQSQ